MASSGITSKRTRFTGAEFIVHFPGTPWYSGCYRYSRRIDSSVYDALSQSTQIRHILGAPRAGGRVYRAGNGENRWQTRRLYGLQRTGRNQPGHRHCRRTSGFHPAGVYHRAGSGLNDRHRRLPEVDTYGISIPITKHNYLVRHISELPQVMSDAFRIAQSGRPARCG